MQCRYSFKHMKSSQALIEYADEKIGLLVDRFVTKPIECHLVFSVEGREQMAHFSSKGGDGFNSEVQASCEDMYGSIDLLVDKLEAQLKKQKEKLKNHKSQQTLKKLKPVEYSSKEDCDSVPVEAEDLIKYEKARIRAMG